ncbi:sugar kinase [Moorella sp. Hama-1]|uniref:sugar kinase n=1 Tax=Moorella sp. Hama-1 TaxID=2138101 RepID=UPI000D6572EF|nr:sugar kinase [Moorella sp. Hama-1]MDN5361975.1 tagatose kinase [Moorella sp. (in: firmicutes)]BCV20593.1 carbohydrate kinase [Moorella sp. Hama-1]
MAKVITIGEILVEIMAKHEGQEFTRPGEFLGPYPSGAPAIFIDQVARMGIDCGIIARVGEDDFGRLNIDRLHNDGVDTDHIYITPGYTTGTAFVTYYPNGERKFIFHFTHAAAGQLAPADIDENYIKAARYLHIMGCSLAASTSLRQAIGKAIKVARANGVIVSFDPNLRPELLSHEGIRGVYNDILSSANIILTGKKELVALTGEEETDAAVAYLQAKGMEMIIIKEGSLGARLYHQGDCYQVPPVRVQEVDPTGAGDCFDGAFIACLAEGADFREALAIANIAGALSVTRKGPMEGAAFKKDILALRHR